MNKHRIKNFARENVDLFIQKNQKVIDYQDNTPTHIILKTDDLITEKTKTKKNITAFLSGLARSKDNSDVTSKILYQNKFDLMNAYLRLYQQ